MRKKFIKYIQESYVAHGHKKLFNKIPIIVKDKFVKDIDINSVFGHIESVLPYEFVDGLDVIYVGSFKELEEKEVNAIYLDGAIYVTNAQSSGEDLIDDLVHEISHFVEEKYTGKIYGQSTIEYEFLKKRDDLGFILQQEGYDVPDKFIRKVEYDKAIDDFLYKDVGYPVLRRLASNLFISPYSITDVREYFGISFENYFLGNRKEVQELTPSVFKVLERLTYGERNEL